MIAQHADELSDLMEFEHVIVVRKGKATSANTYKPGERVRHYAPECIWEGFAGPGGEPAHIESGQDWELLTGFSGQYRYSGPIMHPSEYIGGYLADYILENDGYYVAVVCSVLGDDPDEDEEPAGWAIAYKPIEGE